MIQYILWILIYFASVKFMTKNAGRNNPAWGALFVLLTIPLSLISGFILGAIALILSFSLDNQLLVTLVIIIISTLLSLGLAYLTSLLLKKKDLSKRNKETQVNYTLSAIFIGIVGLVLLTFTHLQTGKTDGWIIGLMFVAIMQTINLKKRSKINANLTVNDFHNKRVILFLRSFNSKGVKAKSKEGFFGLFESGRVEEHIRSLIPFKFSFVAIGNPEDFLPDLAGAEKVYANNDSWKKTASDYMMLSEKIFILEGATNGLLWELEYIKKNISPSKVTILTYPQEYRNSKSYKKNINYMAFVNTLYELGYSLPSYDIGPDSIISLDKNWNTKTVSTGIHAIKEHLT